MFTCKKDFRMQNTVNWIDQQLSPARAVLICASFNDGGIEAQLQADPKKLGKEKKPDTHPVSLVFP